MANINKLTKLAKEIYGKSDERVKELEQMYNATQTEIEGIISHFISDDDNWNLPAPKSLKQRLMNELKEMYKEVGGNDKALISVSVSDRKLATITDAVQISVGIVLIRLAQKRREQLANSLQVIAWLGKRAISKCDNVRESSSLRSMVDNQHLSSMNTN